MYMPEFLSTANLEELINTWGYGVVFAAMVLESAGLPLPGETVTLLGGYAAGSGHLNLVGVIAAASGGAIRAADRGLAAAASPIQSVGSRPPSPVGAKGVI